MTLLIDLVMFKGIGRAGCNLVVWDGGKPTQDQLDALQKYIDDNKGDENEFI